MLESILATLVPDSTVRDDCLDGIESVKERLLEASAYGEVGINAYGSVHNAFILCNHVDIVKVHNVALVYLNVVLGEGKNNV